MAPTTPPPYLAPGTILTFDGERTCSPLADYLFGNLSFNELFLGGTRRRSADPSRYGPRTGTPPRLRRGRGGVMRPSLRVSRITRVLVGRPRHASSTAR